MCGFAPIAQAGLGVVGNYLTQKASAASAQSNMQAQADSAITNMNHKFQNYEQERTDAFDSAVSQLDKVTHSGMGLESGVKVAVNESMGGGRTAGLLIRNSEGDTARTKESIQENYDAKGNEIDLNKDATRVSTKSYIDNLNASAPKMPGAFANFVSTAGTALGSYTDYQNQKQLKARLLKNPKDI